MYVFTLIILKDNICNDITINYIIVQKLIDNYSLPAANGPPMITVFGAGSNVAGSRYIVQCIITLPTGVTVSDVPSVEWRRPSGESTTGNNISGSGRLYMSQLILDPLTLSDGGDYTCTATYNSGGQTSPSGMSAFSFSAISKYRNYI